MHVGNTNVFTSYIMYCACSKRTRPPSRARYQHAQKAYPLMLSFFSPARDKTWVHSNAIARILPRSFLTRNLSDSISWYARDNDAVDTHLLSPQNLKTSDPCKRSWMCFHRQNVTHLREIDEFSPKRRKGCSVEGTGTGIKNTLKIETWFEHIYFRWRHLVS